MGVPKFYRWVSERYPMINQKIVDNNLIPEFDNLYLDMNGIVHNCTHPNDNDPTFRMTEEHMFQAVFEYIDKLVQIIRPQKLLYMAIDGVAPRAKMNQQRARRFRTAKDAEEAVRQARANGKAIPETPAFDSNCITPGTEFMAKLSQHLRYYMRERMRNSRTWQQCKVILSGHEVPGEGEHKIMEYIRQMKSHAAYDPNLRHCLYGLDADLIFLGLLTHEPHFALLREEVNFAKRGSKNLDNFQLLHLALLRDYLDAEFRTSVKLPFEYNLERIIDDWVFVCFFVGNDFLPNLPFLDIGDGALTKMFDTYKEQLGKLGGYINDKGDLNLERVEKYLQFLADYEMDHYAGSIMDSKAWVRAGGTPRAAGRTPRASELDEDLGGEGAGGDGDGDEGPCFVYFDPNTDELAETYVPTAEELEEQKKLGDLLDTDKQAWKDAYYSQKFHDFTEDDHMKLRRAYIEGLVWVIHYYFNGVASWGWYYPFHYAPITSDLVGIGMPAMRFEFSVGEPFQPFWQLLSVLPAASSGFLPLAYRRLMTDPTSPIIDMYPKEFEVDMNGKKNPWEGVVVIPFIDEARFLAAVSTIDVNTLSQLEKTRNAFGQDEIYAYDEGARSPYPSPCPSFFPAITDSPCAASIFRMPPKCKFISDLCEGVLLGKDRPYLFPTLHHLTVKAQMRNARINVFGMDSRWESCVLSPKREDVPLEEVAARLMGATVQVGYPYLHEARVVGLSDKSASVRKGAALRAHEGKASNEWFKNVKDLARDYLAGKGIDLGKIQTLVAVNRVTGLERLPSGARTKTYAKEEELVPLHALVTAGDLRDPRYIEKGAVEPSVEFPPGTRVLHVGLPEYYGAMGTVVEVVGAGKAARLTIRVKGLVREPPFVRPALGKQRAHWMPFNVLQRKVGVSSAVLSRILGSVFITPGRNDIGLKLKFTGKSLQRLGYATAEEDNGRMNWFFSEKALALLQEYKSSFPDVFSGLESDPKADEYTSDSFEGGAKRIAEVVQWVKKQPFREVPMVPVGSSSMSKESLEQALALTTQFLEENAAALAEERVLEGVSALSVFREDDGAFIPAGVRSREFECGDRVVNTLIMGGIPYGARGMVAAVQGHSYDVVLDEAFMGGSTLGGRCPHGRGVTVAAAHLLNLSVLPGESRPAETPSASHPGRGGRGGRGGFTPREAPTRAQPANGDGAGLAYPYVAAARGGRGGAASPRAGISPRGGGRGGFVAETPRTATAPARLGRGGFVASEEPLEEPVEQPPARRERPPKKHAGGEDATTSPSSRVPAGPPQIAPPEGWQKKNRDRKGKEGTTGDAKPAAAAKPKKFAPPSRPAPVQVPGHGVRPTLPSPPAAAAPGAATPNAGATLLALLQRPQGTSSPRGPGAATSPVFTLLQRPQPAPAPAPTPAAAPAGAPRDGDPVAFWNALQAAATPMAETPASAGATPSTASPGGAYPQALADMFASAAAQQHLQAQMAVMQAQIQSQLMAQQGGPPGPGVSPLASPMAADPMLYGPASPFYAAPGGFAPPPSPYYAPPPGGIPMGPSGAGFPYFGPASPYGAMPPPPFGQEQWAPPPPGYPVPYGVYPPGPPPSGPAAGVRSPSAPGPAPALMRPDQVARGGQEQAGRPARRGRGGRN